MENKVVRSCLLVLVGLVLAGLVLVWYGKRPAKEPDPSEPGLETCQPLRLRLETHVVPVRNQRCLTTPALRPRKNWKAF